MEHILQNCRPGYKDLSVKQLKVKAKGLATIEDKLLVYTHICLLGNVMGYSWMKMSELVIKLQFRAVKKEAAQDWFKRIEIPDKNTKYTIQEWMGFGKYELLRVYTSQPGEHIKNNLILTCDMEKTEDVTGQTIVTGDIKTWPVPTYSPSALKLLPEINNFPELYCKMSKQIFENLETFMQHGSDWNFHSGVRLDKFAEGYC